MSLRDKVALITGASRGIGHAIALELARQGAVVVGTGTELATAQKITQSLEQQHFRGKGLVMNIVDESSVAQGLAAIHEEFGAPAILVNNAGITCDNLTLRMKQQEWDVVINTDLTSVYRLTKACLRHMIKARWGRIINISSIVAFTGNFGQANYAAAKAGIIGFTKSIAQEIATRGVTANIIAPGFIDTDMTRALPMDKKELLLAKIPLQRLGQPRDVAYTAAFLASEEAEYITGQTLHVNGGMFMN